VQEYYGDLDDPGGVEVGIKSAVFGLKPVFMVYRGQYNSALCSDHDDKIVILTGSTKTALYRCFPVIKQAE
jgi:hypothetical protein